MKIKLASLSADLSKEREGEWVPVKEWPGLDPDKPYELTPLPGLEFLVRSTNYPDYKTARQDSLEKLKQDYPDDKIPADVQARIEGELSVEHLLLGWKGLDVDYSPDLVSTILIAEEHRVMRQMIFWCAGRVGKKKVEFVKAASKN